MQREAEEDRTIGVLHGNKNSNHNVSCTQSLFSSTSDTSLDVVNVDNYSPLLFSSAEYSQQRSMIKPQLGTLETDMKLNGFMLVGKTWNITEVDGYITLFRNEIVRIEPPNRFQGFPEAINCKHRFEISLASIDNSILSVLILSDNIVISKTGKRDVIVKTSAMSGFVRQAVLDSMRTSNCASWIQNQVYERNDVMINASDWNTLGPLVAKRLANHGNYYLNAFPMDSKFFFLVTKSSPGTDYEKLTRTNLYPHFRKSGLARIIVHVAQNFHMDNHVLFFNKSSVIAQPAEHTKEMDIAMIPTIRNISYHGLEPNPEHVNSVYLHTSLFEQFTEEPISAFQSPYIAKTLLNAYMAKLNNGSLCHLGEINAILDGSVEKMINRLRNILHRGLPSTATAKCVWSKNCSNGEDVRLSSSSGAYVKNHLLSESIIPLLLEAFNDCVYYVTRTGCIPADALTAVEETNIKRYFDQLLNPFFNTITNNISNVRDILRLGNTTKYTKKLPELQDFTNTFVAEAMVCKIISGNFENYPKFLESFVLENISEEDWLETWPFNDRFIRKAEHETIRTNVSTEKVFPGYAIKLLDKQHNATVLTDFKKLYRSWTTVTNPQLLKQKTDCIFQGIVFILLQGILSLKQIKTLDDEAIEKIWCQETPSSFPEKRVVGSNHLYSLILLSSLKNLKLTAPIILFLKHLRMQMIDNYGGGTQLALAQAADMAMYNADLPFALKLAGTSVLVFVPVTFVKHPSRYETIYQKTFENVYNRDIGTRRIPVSSFIKVLTNEICQLSKQDRNYLNMSAIFFTMNQLLDSTNALVPVHFRKLHPRIQQAFSNITTSPRHQSSTLNPESCRSPLQKSLCSISSSARIDRKIGKNGISHPGFKINESNISKQEPESKDHEEPKVITVLPHLSPPSNFSNSLCDGKVSRSYPFKRKNQAATANNNESGDDIEIIYTLLKRECLEKPAVNAESNVSCIQSTQSPKPKHVVIKRRRSFRLFSCKDTISIFQFLDATNLLRYMKCRRVCELMAALKVVQRSANSIQKHIQRVVRSSRLADIIGKDLSEKVQTAVADIKSNPNCYILSFDEMAKRFKIKISS